MNYFCNVKTAHDKGLVMPGCKKRGEEIGVFTTFFFLMTQKNKQKMQWTFSESNWFLLCCLPRVIVLNSYSQLLHIHAVLSFSTITGLLGTLGDNDTYFHFRQNYLRVLKIHQRLHQLTYPRYQSIKLACIFDGCDLLFVSSPILSAFIK